MSDTHSPEQRKKNMSAIRGKDTKPEVIIRKELHKRGYRYRKNVKNLPGKPDIVLPKYKAVIFVNGCFWHMHDCKYFKMPNTRREWWKKKLSDTKRRDQLKINELMDSGWRVLVIWECQTKGKDFTSNKELLMNEIVCWMDSQSTLLSIPPA